MYSLPTLTSLTCVCPPCRIRPSNRFWTWLAHLPLMMRLVAELYGTPPPPFAFMFPIYSFRLCCNAFTISLANTSILCSLPLYFVQLVSLMHIHCPQQQEACHKHVVFVCSRHFSCIQPLSCSPLVYPTVRMANICLPI